MADETQEERFERITAAQLVAREQAESLAPRQPAGETSIAKALRETRERIAREALGSAAAAEARPATPEEKRGNNITPSTTPQATNGNGRTPAQIAASRKTKLITRTEAELQKLEE